MKSYLDYMTEHVREILTDGSDDWLDDIELAYVEAADEETNSKFQPVTSYYLKEHFQPLIDKAMTPRGVDSVIEFTGNYIDDHSRELMTGAPLYNFTFGDKETSFLYKLIGITKEELLAMFDEAVKVGYTGENAQKNSRVINVKIVPHIIIITGLLIWAIEHKEEDLKEAIRYLVSFVWYPLIFRGYFKNGVNEATMLYTIEHAGKRYIRQHKTMLSYLHYHGVVCYKNFEDRLKDAKDHVYLDFNNRIRNQINSAMRGIANEYYQNHSANATHHITSDTFEDGNLSDQESNNSKIGQLTDNTFAKFTTTAIDKTVADMVAEGCGCSRSKLNSYLNKLIPLKENKLFKVIENILILFFNSQPADDNVGSGSFLNFGLALYRSLSSSKENSKVMVGNILTTWTTDLLDIAKEYPTRPATVIAFRKALFYYVIFMIQKYNS